MRLASKGDGVVKHDHVDRIVGMPDNFGAQSRFDFDSRPQSHTDDLIVSVVLAADHIGAVGAVILAGFERQLLRPEQDVDGLTGGFCLRVGEHHEAQLGLGAAADSFTWEDVASPTKVPMKRVSGR